jgi:hypothetical protein
VKNLTKNKEEKRARGAKWRRIHERAGELATNRGKRAQKPDERDMRRAKRELLDLQITSPKVASRPKSP